MTDGMTNDAVTEQPKTTKAANKPQKQKTKPARMTVEHTSRGRTRARLSPEHRTPKKMAQIQAELSEHPDVKSVKIDQRTGSIVIAHDETRKGHEVLKEALAGAEELAGLLLEVPIGEDEEGGEGETEKVDSAIADLVSRADEWQARRTGIHGRGAVLSGAIAALGIAQIAIYGISLEMLPGPMLLYIAWDIHRKIREDEAKMEGRAPAEKKTAKGAAAAPQPAAA